MKTCMPYWRSLTYVQFILGTEKLKS